MKVLSLLAAILLSLTGPVALAAGPPQPPPHESWLMPVLPEVSASSWILYDVDSGVEIASADPDRRLPPASTTKIMTALLTLEAGEPDRAVTVSRTAAGALGFGLGLRAGEVLTLGQLLQAVMVRSANDAAVAVAEAVGGSVEGFVGMMNARAVELGLSNSHFVNPNGLDAEDHYSSARDLLLLALAAYSQPGFAELASTTKLALPPGPGGAERVFDTTNRFLVGFRGADGVKTGSTPGAGLVLVASAVREGRRLMAVVMGSNGNGAHFTDAKTLVDYGFRYERLSAVIGRPEERAALAAEVRVEALSHLAALRPQEVVILTLVRTAPGPLPELRDALAWPWSRLAGG